MEQEEQDAQQEQEDDKSDVAMLDRSEPQQQPDDGLQSAEEGQGQQDQSDANANGALPASEEIGNEQDAETFREF